MLASNNQRLTRLGATAVEFALVCPLVLFTIFAMLELSRASTISSATRTSIVGGAREATIAQTNAANVEASMDRILGFAGVNDRQITVTPAVIDGSVDEVNIQVSVPFNAENGQVLGALMNDRVIELSVDVRR